MNRVASFPVRKDIRLRDYDYAADGYYFVTVVTHERMSLLTGIKEKIEKCISDLPGVITGLAIDYFVVMDNHIHAILIFVGCDRELGMVVRAMKYAINKIVGAGLPSRPQGMTGRMVMRPLQESGTENGNVGAGLPSRPDIIYGSNSNSTPTKSETENKVVGAGLPSRPDISVGGRDGNPAPTKAKQAIWQRGYYEHVIRNEQALEKIREYIQNNPGVEQIEFEQFYQDSK